MDRSQHGTVRTPGGHVCIYTCFPALSAERAKGSSGIFQSPDHVSNTLLHYKELGVPEQWLIMELREWVHSKSRECHIMTKVSKCSKNDTM